MSRSSIIVLVALRAFGILFVFVLAFVIFLSVMPGTPSIMSASGLINAPVDRIYTTADGEISELYVEVGQEIARSQEVARIKLETHERAFLLPLQLEVVRLTQRTKSLNSRARHVAEQLALTRGQMAAARRVARDQLAALKEQTASEMRLEQARVARLEAAIDERRRLVEIGLLGVDALYAYQEELETARHQLQLAQSKLVDQKSVVASLDNSVYLESYNRDLATLEVRVRALEREHAEALSEAASLDDQIAAMERLLGSYRDAGPSEEFASVQARRTGMVVSVAASVGDRVVRGDTVARALDCTRAFAVAVFEARDVAGIDIGSPATVKLHTRDAKYNGHVARMLRSFDLSNDNEFFVSFPEARSFESYIVVEVDRDAGSEGPVEASFGCHIGETVSVALGKPLPDRLAQIYIDWRGRDSDMAWSTASDWQHWARQVLQSAVESTTSWLRGRLEWLGGASDQMSGNAIHAPAGHGSLDGSTPIETSDAKEAVGTQSAFDRHPGLAAGSPD